MSLNYTTVTGTFDDGSGTALTGTATFTPSATVYAAGVPLVTPNGPVQALIINGALKNTSGGALTLLATDNAGLTVEGLTGFWYWTVSLSIGGTNQGWSFFLPGSPSTVDLYALADTASGGYVSPLTTLGDTLYENATPAPARLAGNTTATKKFLTQTGTGSVSAAPAWGTIAAGDVPTLNQNTTGSSGSCSGNAATATNLAGGATLPAYLAPAVVALTFGTTINVNAALGNDFRLTLTASTGTIANPTNPVDGQTIEFAIAQDATGSRTVAWGAVFDFGTDGAPTLSTAASKVDLVGFKYHAGLSKWLCMGSKLGF
jgi:hypothetical protein